MRMIASRGFKIRGSGTSRTSTRFLPIQQLAFISDLTPNQGNLLVFGGGPSRMHTPMNTGIRVNHAPRLEHLLEAPQVAGDLLTWLLAEQHGDRGADCAARRLVLELDD